LSEAADARPADCAERVSTVAVDANQVHCETRIPEEERVPKSLLRRRQWVAWWGVRGTGQCVRLPNGEMTAKPLKPQRKPHKLPINPHTGGLAETDRPATWGSYDEAVNAARRFGLTGVGFVFSDDDCLSGIDLDDCRDPDTGEIDDWAMEIIEQLGSYTEVSPSRTGVKIWVYGKLPKGKGNQTRCGRGKVEMFSRGRYFTFTGEPLEGAPKQIESRQEELSALHSRLFSHRKARGAGQAATAQRTLSLTTVYVPRAGHNQPMCDGKPCDLSGWCLPARRYSHPPGRRFSRTGPCRLWRSRI
jgi:primase-polymerase (primpol)-like protein